MPYATGSATSISDLRTNIIGVLSANGWTVDGEMVYKGTCYVRIYVSGSALRITGALGGSGTTPTTPSPGSPAIGNIPSAALTWPATWHVHIGTAPDEVYIFLNYNAVYYQYMAFGQSPCAGLPGTGNWCGASWDPDRSYGNLVIGADLGGGWTGSAPGGSGILFCNYGGWTQGYCVGSYIHHGLDSLGWSGYTPLSFFMDPGSSYPRSECAADAWSCLAPLQSYQPNAWNSETVLLPIRPMWHRTERKLSFVGELGHARYCRISNYEPGDIIEIGPDKWKVYPWLRKNADVPNGGSNVNHSGTFAVAVRYDGP